ncbi:selenide, water dikinase [Fistulifera solaris]|uniref:Selenide, water dikinase n=1 Tax=Fistulifera solaris TaxID=1519565 RepID=A0A1Z5KG18_FISSO|nr:selenide, water dikinase [Fistulifera solaris]|eukprot:GAX25075.1 selenide, water dikinase [Fistulifera solaris]
MRRRTRPSYRHHSFGWTACNFLFLINCPFFTQIIVQGFVMPQHHQHQQQQQHLILVGGGHAHAQVLTWLHDAARPAHLKVTLIDPQVAATYSGMVPGCIGGYYDDSPDDDNTKIDLVALTQWAGIEFVNDAVVDIDLERQCVYLQEHPSPLYYDAISLDVGSTTRGWTTTPGAREYTIPTRPIDALVRRLEDTRWTEDDDDNNNNKPVQLVVVGGGAAGIELSMAITSRWRHILTNIQCTILDAGQQLLPSENEACRQMLQTRLNELNITVRHDAAVAQVINSHVVLQNGNTVPFTHCIWAAGAEAHPLSGHLQHQRGLACTPEGWIAVHPTLQSTSHPAVFAAGDCASIQGLSRGPPPKAGVYAVRAGPVLLQNVLQFLEGRPSKTWTVYEPQEDFLKLLVCGDNQAMGFRFGIPFRGKWVFEMKDAIDRNFMNLFAQENLPDKSRIQRGQYNTQQYDAMVEELTLLEPEEAAMLLQRSDDGVDFQQTWRVLRAMAGDTSYREQVLHFVKQSTASTVSHEIV